MSEAAERAVRAAIKKGEFAPAYYLHGEEEYTKQIVVDELLNAAVEPATRDFNLDIRRGSELDAETLGSLLSTPPMMAERRVVVVRDVQALKKDARAALDRYLDKPASDQIVVLVTPAGEKEDKALSAKTLSVELEALTGARVPKWIAYYAEHELRCRITPSAIELLQEAVGTELTQLRMELDKLGSFAVDGEIDEPAVSAIVGVRRGETVSSLLDAIGARDARVALDLLPRVLQLPKVDAVPIVMMLAVQTLALAYGRSLRDRGMNPGKVSAEFYNLLRSGKAFTGRAWGEAVSAWMRALENWSARDLDDALDALLDADLALKGGNPLSSQEQILGTLILRLCGAKKRRAA